MNLAKMARRDKPHVVGGREYAMRNFIQKSRALGALVVATVAGLQTQVLMAAPAGTYDDLVAAVDWAEVTAAIVAIGALLAAVFVVSRGTKMVLRMIGR